MIRTLRRLAIPVLAVIILGTQTASDCRAGIALDFTGGTALPNFGTLTYGWAFRLSAATDIDGLGLWDEGANGLNASHKVGLWDAQGTLLASTTVTNANSAAVASINTNGQWLFTNIALMSLPAGSYVLGATYSGEDAIRLSTDAPVMATNFFYVQNRFISGDFVFPTSTSSFRGNAYFGPNLRLSTVPEPSTVLGAALGLLAVAARQRRRA